MDLDLVLVDQDLRGVGAECPFFKGLQLPWRRLVSRLVALALHRVLGTLDREAITMQEPTQLILAEADSRDLLQVGRQPFGGPSGETVAQVLRIGGHGFLHGRDESEGRSTRSPWRFHWLERIEPTPAILAANPDDGLGTTAQSLGDLADRISEVRHGDDQAIAEDVLRRRLEPQQIDPIELLVGFTIALLYASPPAASLTENCQWRAGDVTWV